MLEETATERALRVLFVEDDADLARLARAVLRQPHFMLQCESRLDRALAALESDHFDVLLLDLCLPDSAGVFTLGVACNFARMLPIVVLTGVSDERLMRVAADAGARRYLSKGSLEWDTLPDVLRGVIADAEFARRLAGAGAGGGLRQGSAERT